MFEIEKISLQELLFQFFFDCLSVLLYGPKISLFLNFRLYCDTSVFKLWLQKCFQFKK